MATVNEAKEILKALGLPPAQQTDIAAYTLLALAGLTPKTPWSASQRRSIRIHDVLQYTEKIFKKTYAENTRETVRRQVLHQFEQARLVDRNPDEPGLPTNSPRTCYALSESALSAIRAFGSKAFTAEVRRFTRSHGALLEVYAADRKMHRVPVKLEDGTEYMLSPGKHNEVQAAIVEQFAPRFAPGSTLLYLGDTAKKTMIVSEEVLTSIGVTITKHDKLPDVVLYSTESNRLYLIEAVTSHGPVSPKRKFELEQLLSECTAERVYVSAFPDFTEFKKHIANVAWETEVWIVEVPGHMIHFNGDKFLRPA